MNTPNNNDITFFHEAPIWVERIKSAIENNTFEIFIQEIQPINRSFSQKIAEVLIRMKDEKGGYYSPFEFFGFAEKFNLMADIDDWTISETFKMHRNSGQATQISLNLAAETISNILPIENIIKYSRQYRIKPETIIFEITETMSTHNIKAITKHINILKAFGFNIALVNFGSGFSTLQYLQNITVDYLKIDGIFVKNIKNSDNDKAIVEHIASIAHELNIKCIAEFVDDNDCVSILQECGVDYIQGFGIHRPEKCSVWINRYKEN